MSRSKGFAEEQQPFGPKPEELQSVPLTRLKIDNAGRVVVPAEMRTAMKVKPGEAVTAEVVNGELRIFSRAIVLARIQAEAEKFKAENPDVSLVDELIAERREEARREDERDERLQREAAEIKKKRARHR